MIKQEAIPTRSAFAHALNQSHEPCAAFTDLAYGTPVHLIEAMTKARTAFDDGNYDRCTDLLDECAQDGFTTWHEHAAALAFYIADNAERGRDDFS